jgi:hypothetical protein
MIRSNKIRKSAEGEDCDIQSPFCKGDNSTVVWCHSPFQEHGKGVGLKATDVEGCYGCHPCHLWLDVESKRLGVPHDERLMAYYRAHSRSLRKLIDKGIVRIA